MVVELLLDVLFVPLTLGREILVRLKDEVDRELLLTEDSIKERLQQLQLLLQDGNLSEEEYEAMEAELMERLRMVRGQGVSQ